MSDDNTIEESQTDVKLRKLHAKIKASNHVDAKSFILHDLLPLLRVMNADTAVSFAEVDEKFELVYESLDALEEDGGGLSTNIDVEFLENTHALVTASNALIDKLMVAAGYLAPVGDGNYAPTEKLPDDVKEEFLSLRVQIGAWLPTHAEALAAAQEEEENTEDDDDTDESGESDESDGDDAAEETQELRVSPRNAEGDSDA